MPWFPKPLADLLPWGKGSPPAAELYDAIMAQARLPIYYQRLGVPDTLEGRFVMLTLHLFAVLHRLKGQGQEARTAAQALTDRFVTDMDTVLREMGVGDLSVPKKVRKIVSGGAGLIEGYERAAVNGGDALETAIAEALPLDVDAAKATSSKLMPYVNVLLEDLESQRVEAICSGDVRFPAVPAD